MEVEKKLVVIIDDEKDFTELVKEVLEGTGRYAVTEANEGLAGIDLVKKVCPDLILLDLMMPDMDGSHVAVQFKQNIKTQDIPIVFLTAAVTFEEASAQKGKIGGHFFLAKPVGIRELIDCVDQHV